MKSIDKPFTIEACGKKSIRINYVKYVFLALIMTSTFTCAKDIDPVTKDIIDKASTTIQSEISTLKKSYKDKHNILYEDMSRKGQLNGTPMLDQLSKFCLNEIEDYAQLIHKTLLHVVKDSSVSYSDGLATGLKNVAKRYLTGEIGNISGCIKQKNKFGPTLMKRLSFKETELNSKRTNELEKIYSDIDLLIISLKNQEKQLKTSDSSDSSWFQKIIVGVIITIVGGILLALILCYIVKLPFSKQQNSTDETVKIAAKIELDRNTDSSLISHFQDALSKMPELLKDMARALKDEKTKLVREFFVLRNRNVKIGISTKPRLCYFEEDYENLQNKLDILEDYGFITDVRVGTSPIYRMTPKFVQFLLTDIEIT